MPKIRTRERWEHPTYKYAYCIERYGNVYTIIDGTPPSAIKGLKWDIKNKKEALKILNHRLIEKNKPEIFELSKPLTVQDAVNEYANATFSSLDIMTVKSLISTFKLYLPADASLNDLSFIRNHIIQKSEDLKHNDNTRNKALTRLKRFFNFCVDQDIISKNPVVTSMIPLKYDPEPTFFSFEEINNIYEYFISLDTVVVGPNITRKRQEKEMKLEYALTIKLMSLIGTRGMETLKIFWDKHDAPIVPHSKKDEKSYIEFPNKIFIDGKRHKFNITNIREFPLNLVPESIPILGELKQFKNLNNGKLVKWQNIHPLERWLKIALKELKIDDTRNLHSLRKTATNYWEKVLGIPPHICSRMAGHGQEVRKKVYDKSPTAEEMVNMFNQVKSSNKV
jgi:integrase